MPTSQIIFGCGYLGLRVAQLWRDAGSVVSAASRSCDRAAELQGWGLLPIVADVTKPETLRNLPPAVTLLYAVGFDRNAGADIQSVYAGGLQNALSAMPTEITRVIYISTTGVYGSAYGEWVDETTPPDPQREGGKASLAAERVLASHPLGRRSAILRLAGLYGPGRVPYLDRLRSGEPLPVPCEGWLNLIHVDDAARIVVAVDQWLALRSRSDGPHVFCVSDGAPVVRGAYYAEVARLVNAPPPRFTTPPADSATAARATADRRICNRKLMETIGVQLAYPSYRAGLDAILTAQGC